MANPEPSYPFKYHIGNHILRKDAPLSNCVECRINRARQNTVMSGTSKNPFAVITRLSTNSLRTFLLSTQQMTPDNVSWIVQIQLETVLWPSPDSPLPPLAPAVICIDKDTLVFCLNGKSGWFAAAESQHVFSNGRIVELLTFTTSGGDAVQAGPDPAFDYIGTISIQGLHATSVKGKSLSEISKEEYQRLPEEAQITLGDVKECSWIGFAVVGSNPTIKQTFGPESPSVNVRDLAIPLPAPSSPSLQPGPNAPSPEPEPLSLPSSSKNTGAKGFRKRSFSKYADRPWFPFILGRAMRNSEAQKAGGTSRKERPQCPLHSKICKAALSNQNAIGTGEEQGQAAGEEEPANDVGSANISSKGPGAQSSITPPSPATKSETTDTELPPLEYSEAPQWKPGLNIIKTSWPSTDAPKTSGQVLSTGCSGATSLQAVIPREAHSNNSDVEDPSAKKRKRELSTPDTTSAHPIELSNKKPRPEVP